LLSTQRQHNLLETDRYLQITTSTTIANTANMQNTLIAGFFAQLCLAALALAAPVAEQVTIQKTDAWQYGTGGGIIGLIVLILDVIVFGKSPAPPPLVATEPLC
jgi:hypothetical protein